MSNDRHREMTPEEEARGFNPPPSGRLWRDRILPRSITPLFWLAWLALLPSRLLAKVRRVDRPRRLAIESGIIGWTHVYFEELWESARERYGSDSVFRQMIDRDQPYLSQFRANLDRDAPTHVVLDVRTPNQKWTSSLREAFFAARDLLKRDITPIVVLTDAFYRRQRWHAAVLTAHSGVVVTFANRSIVGPIFPHKRIRGPLPMPISISRQQWLEAERAKRPNTRGVRVQFIGSVYPPRDRFLAVVGGLLKERGIEFWINGDKAGTSNEDYWRTLVDADVIVTTTMQGPPRPHMDWIWVQQAVFRYAESTAAGAALVAAPVDGGFPYFVKDQDFLEFHGVHEAVECVTRLVEDPQHRTALAEQGHATSRRLSTEFAFWEAIDQALGSPAST